VGRYLRGRTWIFGCLCEGIFASFLAGNPGEDELSALSLAYAVPAARAKHAVLFDGSRLQSLDASALGLLLNSMVSSARRLTRNLERVAVVHGAGATGAVIAGYPEVIGIRCETRKFTDTVTALAWLGAAGELCREAAELASSIMEDDAHLVRLRAYLAAHLDAAIDDAARELGMAKRSLQRHLQVSGTGWQREIDLARLAAAEKLLSGDRTLTQVALEVGFSSLQSFSDWFRAQVGKPASSWRRQRR
jgi:AraC-like DNA-binding protein